MAGGTEGPPLPSLAGRNDKDIPCYPLGNSSYRDVELYRMLAAVDDYMTRAASLSGPATQR